MDRVSDIKEVLIVGLGGRIDGWVNFFVSDSEVGVTMVKAEECVAVGMTVMSDFTSIGVNGKVWAAEVGEIWN